MKSYFITGLILKNIDGVYAELTSDFGYYSAKFNCIIWVPKGFITDLESVPFFRSKSKRAGVLHDMVCRIDAYPAFTKYMAAMLYLEAMATRDRSYYANASWIEKIWSSIYRFSKAHIVRWCPGYWKKHYMNATYEEMRNG